MKRITKEFCNKEILRLYAEHGKVTKDILKTYGNISMAPINRIYGGLAAALNELDIPLVDGQARNYSKQEIVDDILRVNQQYGYVSKPLYEKEGKYNQKVVRRIFGSFSNMYEELNVTRHPSGYIASDEELLDDLKRLNTECGMVTQDIVAKFGKFSTTAYKDRFQNMNNAYSLAGLPNRNAGECSHAMWVINRYAKYLNEVPIHEHRFDWLINPLTQRHLPVDGYFEKSNIVIEYNGPQHYHFYKRYHKDENDFLYRQVLDEFKYHTIKEHNVKLIVIDYRDSFTEEYIINSINNITE